MNGIGRLFALVEHTSARVFGPLDRPRNQRGFDVLDHLDDQGRGALTIAA